MELYYPKIITEIKNHSREVRSEAENIKNQVLNWLINDEAPNRKHLEWITIDKESSKDLDDWIWVEKTKEWYSLFISIADISEIIRPRTILDNDAYSRSTSVYTNSHVYHMFPNEISTDLASLNHNTKRYTITTRIDLNKNYKAINSEIFESIFHNKKRFNYSEFNKQFNNYWEDYHSDLNLFHKIAKWLYQNRIWLWAKNDYKEKVTLKIDNEQKETDENNSVASFIIQEFMVLANIENAKINFKEKINWIYRLHMPELKWKMSSTQEIQRAFYNFRNWFHYWLWENFYWHFTSPIRRYADLINHRQQKAWLRDKKSKNSEIYNINEIRKIIFNINSTIEKTIELEKEHNEEATNKRIERFLKRLAEDNFNTISSITWQRFSKLIKFFIQNPDYLNIHKINEEIIYRIEYDLLDKKSIARITSWANSINQLNIFKEIINSKKEANELIY